MSIAKDILQKGYKQGDMRVRRHFAFFPTIVEGGWIWFRRYYQVEEYNVCGAYNANQYALEDYGWCCFGPPTLYNPELNDSHRTMQYIDKRMEVARQYKLETEVITWAFYAMKADPKISIEQAIAEGCEEWDV